MDEHENNPPISDRARAELEARTATTVAGHADVQGELDDRGDEPPTPGDLYVVAEVADHPLEWLVVETDATTEGRVRVVPADSQPLVGSADVALADDAPAGPLALRCDHDLWIGLGLLDPERRTGRVADEALDPVRRRLAGEELDPSTEQIETDSDPEYQLWIEDVVAPARAILEAVPREAATREDTDRPPLRLVPGSEEGAEEPPSPPARVPARRFGWRSRLARVAALPLAACIVWLLVGAPGWRDDPAVATLTLVADTRSGGEPTLTLAEDTAWVELHVDLGGDDRHSSYRATLSTLAGGEVWRVADLVASVTDWGRGVVVRLPADRLPSGDYELALEGVADGEVEEVGYYAFRVARSP